MPIRPTDMQQIFSNKNSVEKVQQNINDKHLQQQQAAVLQQQKQARASEMKSSKSSEDSGLGFKEKQEKEYKEPLKNKQHGGGEEKEDNESENTVEAGTIDIRV